MSARLKQMTNGRNGAAREYRGKYGEGATLTVNLDTFVVVMRYGSDWENPLVVRATTRDDARGAWKAFHDYAVKSGFAVVATEVAPRTVEEFKAKVMEEQCGFLTTETLKHLIGMNPAEPVLIRWHEGRAVVRADVVEARIACTTWCLRDVSLPAN